MANVLPRATARPGRGARHVIGLLAFAFAMGQALVLVHGYAHAPVRTGATCPVCLLGSQMAPLPHVPPELLAPHDLSVQLGAVPDAPYVRPVHRTRIARAPPPSRPTSEAS